MPPSSRLNVMPAATMVVVTMRHGADDAELVGDAGQPRQVLTNPKTRRPRRDGPKRAANVAGRRRLHIESLELTRPAEQQHEDDRARAALMNGSGRTSRGVAGSVFSVEQR